MLAWAPDPAAAWRRMRTWEGALVIATVAVLGVIAVSTDEPVTYMIFPALIWAAFRFGPPGATLAIAIAAGVAIGVTANDVGPFFKQPIDHRTLSTQALHRRRGAHDAVPQRGRQRARALLRAAGRGKAPRGRADRRGAAPDRARSARFGLAGVVLDGSAHPHRPEGARAGGHEPGRPARARPERDRRADQGAQSEMRTLIFELGRDPVEDGLVAALAKHGSRLGARDGLTIDVEGPDAPPRALARAPRPSCSASGARRSPTSSKHAGGEQGVGARRGSTGTRAPRDQRRRPGLRPGRAPPRSLRPRVDAQPRGRDRRAPDDHEQRPDRAPSSAWRSRPSRKALGWRLSPTTRSRVLVVDDHAVVRRGLLAFLDSEPDLEVVGDADGGAQALDAARTAGRRGRRPDVSSWTSRWSRSTASSRPARSAPATTTWRSWR